MKTTEIRCEWVALSQLTSDNQRWDKHVESVLLPRLDRGSTPRSSTEKNKTEHLKGGRFLFFMSESFPSNYNVLMLVLIVALVHFLRFHGMENKRPCVLNRAFPNSILKMLRDMGIQKMSVCDTFRFGIIECAFHKLSIGFLTLMDFLK